MNSHRPSTVPGKRLALPLSVVTWTSDAGATMATIVCKASYELTASGAIPAALPCAIRAEDEPWADSFSLRQASDLTRAKTGFELFVTGHVHAPQGRPIPSLRARVRLGDIHKSVDVHGERAWDAEGQLYRLPFVRMPIVWERSAMASHAAAHLARALDGVRLLPNFVPEGHEPRSPGDPIPCEGLGPLPPGHASRTPRNVAPLNQRALSLRTGELLELDHLHPTLPFVRVTLPRLAPVASVRARGLTDDVVPLWADTLVIDSDAGRVELIFRGHVQLPRPDDTLEVALYDSAAREACWTEPLAPQPTLPAMPMICDALPFGAPPSTQRPAAHRPISSAPPMAPTFGPKPTPVEPRLTPPGDEDERRPRVATMEMPQEAAAVPRRPSQPPDPATFAPRAYGTLLGALALGASKELLLEPLALDDAGWTALSEHIERAARDGLRRGRCALRDEIDAGYVEALEAQLGPIDPATCARASLAHEGDSEGQVSRDLGWPAGAAARVVRVFMARASADPRVRVSLHAALQEQRQAHP